MYPAVYQLNIITISGFMLLTEAVIAYLYFEIRLVILLHVTDEPCRLTGYNCLPMLFQ